MNALLVDDDRFVVAALEKKINWEQLTITEVLTAFNIRQAQKIIEKNSIDICVCDIEMPGGSGLDLLSWVRESGKEIQFIFLTSYADFDYAKKAIELSSLDYQLKPIDCYHPAEPKSGRRHHYQSSDSSGDLHAQRNS